MRIYKNALLAFAAISFISCSEDNGPIILPPVESAIIDAQVGGENQPNQVYLDLSSESTAVVARNSFDLGFYTGSDFRVALNNSTGALALSLDKNDLTQVTAQDTLGLGAQLDVNAIFGALFGPPPAWLSEAASWMDNPNGELSQTAISAISSTDSDNQVYILNRGSNPDGSNRGWKKIRVIRNGEGYQLQHANIDDASFETLNISKDSDFAFVQMNFDSGVTEATPRATDWDIAFTTFTNLLPVGPGVSIPYQFKDYVISNATEVQLTQVDANEVSYENFSTSDLAELTFENNISGIGSSWRTVAQPNSPDPTGVVDDIFYVLKDNAENYYKIRFTRLVNAQTGERGFPQLQYDLIAE